MFYFCARSWRKWQYTISPDGGIGRRAGLKILFPLGSVGSIPTPGTDDKTLINSMLNSKSL